MVYDPHSGVQGISRDEMTFTYYSGVTSAASVASKGSIDVRIKLLLAQVPMGQGRAVRRGSSELRIDHRMLVIIDEP